MSTEVLTAAEHKMARAVEARERDFQGIRTGRASTSHGSLLKRTLPLRSAFDALASSALRLSRARHIF